MGVHRTGCGWDVDREREWEWDGAVDDDEDGGWRTMVEWSLVAGRCVLTAESSVLSTRC